MLLTSRAAVAPITALGNTKGRIHFPYQTMRSNAVSSTRGVKLYLFWSVNVFVESFEGINVELHKLSKQVKVAL